MKKKTGLLIGVIVLTMAVVLVFLNRAPFSSLMFGASQPDDVKPSAETIIPQQSPPDVDLSYFEEIHTFINDVKQSTDESMSQDKEMYLNVESLYEAQGKGDPERELSFIDFIPGISCSDTIKLESAFVTKALQETGADSSAPQPLVHRGDCVDENGNMKSDFSYLVLDETITNIGDTIADFASYASAITLFCFDDAGEIYYLNTEPAYVSLQEGPTVETIYHYYDFQNGEALNVRYIFTMPDEALDNLQICAVYNQFGDSSYDPSYTQLVNLNSLLKS